ncbi:MAG: phage holin family protein [Myxococcaceae bacterium]
MSQPHSHRTSDGPPATTELLVQLVGELGHLVSQHVALAKLELGTSARRTGLGVAQIAACAPLVLVGYAFLNAALALALGRWLPLAGAVAVVGLLNVGGGILGVLLAARAFRRPMLDDSVSELERTAQALAPRATRALDGRQ